MRSWFHKINLRFRQIFQANNSTCSKSYTEIEYLLEFVSDSKTLPRVGISAVVVYSIWNTASPSYCRVTPWLPRIKPLFKEVGAWCTRGWCPTCWNRWQHTHKSVYTDITLLELNLNFCEIFCTVLHGTTWGVLHTGRGHLKYPIEEIKGGMLSGCAKFVSMKYIFVEIQLLKAIFYLVLILRLSKTNRRRRG